MTRYHATPEGQIPFLPEEEAEWDAREAAEIVDGPKRQWEVIRTDRNQRLADCDWTQLSDAPLTNTKTANWASYRQSLRDITTQSDPFNINWPVAP
jgi:hypothetical protein